MSGDTRIGWQTWQITLVINSYWHQSLLNHKYSISNSQFLMNFQCNNDQMEIY